MLRNSASSAGNGPRRGPDGCGSGRDGRPGRLRCRVVSCQSLVVVSLRVGPDSARRLVADRIGFRALRVRVRRGGFGLWFGLWRVWSAQASGRIDDAVASQAPRPDPVMPQLRRMQVVPRTLRQYGRLAAAVAPRRLRSRLGRDAAQVDRHDGRGWRLHNGAGLHSRTLQAHVQAASSDHDASRRMRCSSASGADVSMFIGGSARCRNRSSAAGMFGGTHVVSAVSAAT